MATVSYRDDRDTWQVRWREPKVIRHPDGTTTTKWSYKKRSAPSKKAAEALAREVENQAAVGERWEDSRKRAVATVRSAVEGYVIASKRRPKATQRYRASVLQRWLDFVGEGVTIDTLTTETLREYADSLDAAGIRSVSRYVGTVEQWWKWVHNNRETYPGTPEPRRLTGADAEIQHKPAPAAIDTPTWADVDAMLHALTPEGAPSGGKGVGYRPAWEQHRRVALVQRYTGLRISQVLSLTWDDLDLDRKRLTLRSDVVGAKGQGRDRVVPLHPALAHELAGWGIREGLLFSRIATKGPRKGQRIPLKGSQVSEVLAGNDRMDRRTGTVTHTAGAWERAGVSRDKWGAAGQRANKRATNAIRARWKSTIAGAASYELARLMLGQSTSGDHDSYVAMGNPEASPYWPAMVRALTAVPKVEAGTTNVVRIVAR